MPLGRREAIPAYRLCEIFLDAKSSFIAPTHVVLRNERFLFGGLSVPFRGRFQIFGGARPSLQAGSITVLCGYDTLSSSIRKKRRSLFWVVLDSLSRVVTVTKEVFRGSVTRRGCALEPFGPLARALADARPIKVAASHLNLSERIVLLCRKPE